MDAIEGFDIGGGGNLDPETAALLLQVLSGAGGMGASTALPQPPTGRALPAGNATAAIAGAPPERRQAALKPDIWNLLLNGGAAMMEAGGRPGATTLGALGTGLKHGLATDDARQVRQAQLDAALNNAEMRRWQAMLAAAGRRDTLAQQGAYRQARLGQIDSQHQAQQDYRNTRLDQIDRQQGERESMNQSTRDHRAAMRAMAEARLNLSRTRANGPASVTPYQRANLITRTFTAMRREYENMGVSDEDLKKRAELQVDNLLGKTAQMPAPDDAAGDDPETAQDPLDEEDDADLYDYPDVTETETVFPSTMSPTAAPTRRGTLRGPATAPGPEAAAPSSSVAYSVSNPASPRTAQAYEALPSGSYFRDPQGQLRIKP